MNRALWVALLVIGVILLFYGFNASNSFSSDISRTFSGSPTDKSIWLIVAGAAATIVGLVGTVRGTRKT